MKVLLISCCFCCVGLRRSVDCIARRLTLASAGFPGYLLGLNIAKENPNSAFPSTSL